MNSGLPSLPFNPSLLLEQMVAMEAKLASQERLRDYSPYAKQILWHHATLRERMLMAGNQLGKTLAAGNEVAMHLTGLYPEWWEGKRFDRPTRGLAGSESSELTRKGIQRILLGPPENENQWGTGTIPKATLEDWSRKTGVPLGGKYHCQTCYWRHLV